MKAIHLLALLPFLGFLSGGWLLSIAPAMVFGIPFLLVWNLAWMVGCTVCLVIIYRHDKGAQENNK